MIAQALGLIIASLGDSRTKDRTVRSDSACSRQITFVTSPVLEKIRTMSNAMFERVPEGIAVTTHRQRNSQASVISLDAKWLWQPLLEHRAGFAAPTFTFEQAYEVSTIGSTRIVQLPMSHALLFDIFAPSRHRDTPAILRTLTRVPIPFKTVFGIVVFRRFEIHSVFGCGALHDNIVSSERSKTIDFELPRDGLEFVESTPLKGRIPNTYRFRGPFTFAIRSASNDMRDVLFEGYVR